jgi:hypothetical protein
MNGLKYRDSHAITMSLKDWDEQNLEILTFSLFYSFEVPIFAILYKLFSHNKGDAEIIRVSSHSAPLKEESAQLTLSSKRHCS